MTETVASLFACIALGAALYRWRGHGRASGPRWLKLALAAAFLALPAELERGLALEATWDGLIVLAAFLAALWGLSRAHGSYYDLGHNGAGSEDDWRWAELQLAAVRWLPLREGLLLALTGLAATAGPGLALLLLGDWGGLWLAASGALKAPAYAIGWTLTKGRRATEIGEWLTGAFMGLGVGNAVG